MKELETAFLLDLDRTVSRELWRDIRYPWEILDRLQEGILRLAEGLDEREYARVGPGIWIARDGSVAPSAVIQGPCIVDHGAEIRPGAYLRGGVIVGRDCVVGNSTEVKNAVLFDGVQIPHYNYVGDSVLGYKAHLGAGAVCSNVKSDRSPVTVSFGVRKIPTGRRKLGAVVGDFGEVGCNAVLCPGTVLGRRTTVYPLCRVRGFVPPDRIWKDNGHITVKRQEGGMG